MKVSRLPDIQQLLHEPYFSVSEDALFRQIENEAVLLHISSGMYYSLNETGIPFWEALRDRQPLQTAVDRVLTSYHVEQEQVIQDLQKFLRILLEYKLVSVIH
jgi:Coenzyme PQQ synthesis protein D (PqqD)